MSWNPFRARRERATRRLAAVLLEHPDDQHFGWPLFRSARIPAGGGYPILTRMLVAGWLIDGWEEDPGDRPPRRYYKLTELGRLELGMLAGVKP